MTAHPRLELLFKQPQALPAAPEVAARLIATFNNDDVDLGTDNSAGVSATYQVTADDGSFRLEAPSGNQTITVSLSGYVTRTMPVNVVPGAERSVGAVQLASSELITMIGWAVAILAIALVMIIYYVRRERGRKRRWSPPKRQMKGKPRSWRKMEKAERRPRRTEHTLDDFEPDDRRYEYEDDVFGPNERL